MFGFELIKKKKEINQNMKDWAEHQKKINQNKRWEDEDDHIKKIKSGHIN